MRLGITLLALALVLGAVVVATPTASAAHCGLDPLCIADNVVQCTLDALERNPPQFWCEA